MVSVVRWPVEKLLQLPDWCFGRRFLVTCTVQATTGTRRWDISEVALPEVCVIWEFDLRSLDEAASIVNCRIALGDQLPATVAQMNVLEPLFNGFGQQGPDPRTIYLSGTVGLHYDKLRMPVAAMGRRLILQNDGGEANPGLVMVGIVVSGMPKEVPEWLLSGMASSR